MHEINTVAETITTAADPEANIIFGATINPELEGEIIVTVVATGFDESYYARRDAKTAELLRDVKEPAEAKIDDKTMAGIDMEIPETMEASAEDFHNDDTPNIWALSDDGNGTAADDNADDEDELDKPSFLRRAFKRKGSDERFDVEDSEESENSKEDK